MTMARQDSLVRWTAEPEHPHRRLDEHIARDTSVGGIGVLVPSLTRIRPGLAVTAALGCAALQVSAIAFHVSRGEAANTPFNAVLVALALFVAWGRRSRAPITPRS